MLKTPIITNRKLLNMVFLTFTLHIYIYYYVRKVQNVGCDIGKK